MPDPARLFQPQAAIASPATSARPARSVPPLVAWREMTSDGRMRRVTLRRTNSASSASCGGWMRGGGCASSSVVATEHARQAALGTSCGSAGLRSGPDL